MNTKSIVKWALVGLGVIILISVISGFIGFSNREIELKNSFNQKLDERTASYDKMYKVISQKTQIAVKNDSSFRLMVNTIMEGRKDAQQVVFKWVQEQNPGATFDQVTKLYSELGRTVEAQREEFFQEEKMLQDINRVHNDLIEKYPGSLYNIVFGRKAFVYTPIKSSLTEAVMKTGKDDNIKLDL